MIWVYKLVFIAVLKYLSSFANVKLIDWSIDYLNGVQCSCQENFTYIGMSPATNKVTEVWTFSVRWGRWLIEWGFMYYCKRIFQLYWDGTGYKWSDRILELCCAVRAMIDWMGIYVLVKDISLIYEDLCLKPDKLLKWYARRE